MEPRYYDPIKEELKERTERIKREANGESVGEYSPGRISFDRKVKSGANTSLLQLSIASILGLTTLGWLYLGNEVFYVFWLAVPVYAYFRFRKPSRPEH